MSQVEIPRIEVKAGDWAVIGLDLPHTRSVPTMRPVKFRTNLDSYTVGLWIEEPTLWDLVQVGQSGAWSWERVPVGSPLVYAAGRVGHPLSGDWKDDGNWNIPSGTERLWLSILAGQDGYVSGTIGLSVGVSESSA